ncbi:phage GP46 family protein [Pseudomonas sp. GD04158]|uniref:phage GP46 family protein n=1 Tax=Pseudomonas sp. GD04158 TaxID=2975439 RepID=UPI00244B90BD|nr:phage GP46 family protein [Pseudomonas sp. GD04158]MDH0098250.1 phage GP46 family protein [Pseudomonas sp. GD04158]
MAITEHDEQTVALHRAAVISLLTWRRAGVDDPLDDAERYGWWGDSFPSQADDRIGSRLYLLRRRSLTAQTERDARDYAREALQWLLDDGRVAALDIATARGVDRLEMRLVLTTPEGERVTVQLDNLWQVIHAV